jgi:hypothetical protein
MLEINIDALVTSICDRLPDGYEAGFVPSDDPVSYDDQVVIYAGSQDTGWHIQLMDAGHEMQICHHDAANKRLNAYETVPASRHLAFALIGDVLALHLQGQHQ